MSDNAGIKAPQEQFEPAVKASTGALSRTHQGWHHPKAWNVYSPWSTRSPDDEKHPWYFGVFKCSPCDGLSVGCEIDCASTGVIVEARDKTAIAAVDTDSVMM